MTTIVTPAAPLVCAWCTPRAQLELLLRASPGQSHGICPACIEKMEREAA